MIRRIISEVHRAHCVLLEYLCFDTPVLQFIPLTANVVKILQGYCNYRIAQFIDGGNIDGWALFKQLTDGI